MRRPAAFRFTVAALPLLAASWPALAHMAGEAPALTVSWGGEPLVVLSMLLSGLLYVAGMRRLYRRAPRGRPLHRRQAAAFAAGWLALAAAFLSPLDGLSALLFSAHMVQHEVMMLVAAPLLVMGRP